MTYMFQFLIIAAVSFVGELLSLVVPLPIPGSVYGLLLLLVLLITGVVKLRHIEKAADFLIQIMPMLFIAPAVSVLPIFDRVADSLLAVALVCVVSTLVVMIVTGVVAQALVNRKEGRKHE